MSNVLKGKQGLKNMVLTAVLTAVVIVLQLLGSFIRFGPFSISLVLLPIVLGAALCGVASSTWLGFVFGMAVLLSGDAASFMVIDVFGTILTVLLKGTLCGFAAGFVYKALRKVNEFLAIGVAAVVCPVVNTGVFLLGCSVFFMDAISQWGVSAGFSNTVAYMFLGLAGGNFIFELIINVILSPVIIRVLNFKKTLAK